MRTASAAAAVLLAVLAAPARGEEINRIVLRVNDRIATLRDYESRRESRLAAIATSSDLSLEERRKLSADAGRTTMRELFEELLILSRAQQLHIEATPAKIDRALEQARRRFGIESDEEFAAAVEQSGGSMAEFRDRMARNILFSEVVQREVSPKVKVDDEEVARYWREHPQEFAVPEQRRVQEAVVREDGTLEAAARSELAVRLRDAVISGRSIADAVADEKAESEVIVLDHEWIERGTLDASLEAAVWELASGGVAGPIPARGGLHVLHLLEIKPPSVRPLEQVRPRILNRMQEEQFDRLSTEFLDDLARNALIVERLPADAAGYRAAEVGERDPVRALLRREGGSRAGGQSAPPATAPTEAAPTPASDDTPPEA